MKVIKTSEFTGVVNTREINITPEQYLDWVHGTLIQDAMPHLSDDDREFLMTGCTPEEWDAMFGEEDDYVPSDEIVAMSAHIDESEIPF